MGFLTKNKKMVFGSFYPVNVHKAHAHEYNFIESIGTQDSHAKSLDQQHRDTMNILRKEYLSQNADTDKYLCYRHCFKFTEKKYAEFCLTKNCNGANFKDAAKFMGYSK